MADDPAWLAEARAQLGVAETPGPKSTPKILQWARQLGAKVLGISYTDDAVPWCSLFAAMCVQAAGLAPPKIAIRASSWATWGEPLERAALGAILVFQRPGGGHVGFAVAETSTAYRVLGGNQGDRVSYAWIAKARCVAIRWPLNTLAGPSLPVLAQADPLSRNEA